MYEGGKLYVSSGRRTRKVRNIEADGRVAFTVEDSTRQRVVVGRGTARILPTGKPHDELLKKLVVHPVGSFDHPYAKIMMGADRVLLEIAPTTVKSRDLPPSEEADRSSAEPRKADQQQAEPAFFSREGLQEKKISRFKP